MIKIYSKSCEHVFRMVSRLSQATCDEVFLAKDICRKSRVPEHSARKGLQLLVQRGILKAVTGPGGGYKFKIHPREVPLLRVVETLDGDEAYQKCVMGLHRCSSKSPCAMHVAWMDLRERLFKELRNKALFDLMKKKKS